MESTYKLRMHTRQQTYHAHFNIIFHVWLLKVRILIALSQKDGDRNIALLNVTMFPGVRESLINR